RHGEPRRQPGCGRIHRSRHLSRHRRGAAGGQRPALQPARGHLLPDRRRADLARHHLLQSRGLDRPGQEGIGVKAEVRRLSRAETQAAFDDLAALRIEVFRDFPYLYDGDRDYERRYLTTYLEAPGAVVVGAVADGALVGAATGSPLTQHEEAFSAPF